MARIIGDLSVELYNTRVVGDDGTDLDRDFFEAQEVLARFKELQGDVHSSNFGPLGALIHDAVVNLASVISSTHEKATVGVDHYAISIEQPRL